ncbi:MAG: LytTR family DNA-binding domain-containing protein, partial [Bacteroidota bacterium]
FDENSMFQAEPLFGDLIRIMNRSFCNYCRLYFGEERPLILKSLNYLEDVLDPKVFFRINRAQIVNLKEVDQILPWHGGRLQLTLKSGEKLEVSRRQTAKLKDIYSL